MAGLYISLGGCCKNCINPEFPVGITGNISYKDMLPIIRRLPEYLSPASFTSGMQVFNKPGNVGSN
jgi:hypothetical protein